MSTSPSHTEVQGNLWKFVDNRLVQGIQPNETPTHLATRRALQALGIAIAAIGKYPFIAIAKKAGGDNEAYGIALAYGNTASFAALISWALLNIIDEQMRPLSKEEAALLSQKQSRNRNRAVLAGSIAVGLISQMPFAYLAYVYNGKRVEMPVLMMLSDSWFPTYSTFLSLNAVLAQRKLSDFEKDLAAVRNKLICLIDENRALLDRPNGRMDYVQALQAFRSQEDGRRAHAYLLHMLEGRVRALDSEALCCEGKKCVKVGNSLSWLIGTTAFLSNMGAIGYVSYLGWKMVYDEPGFDGVFAALAVGANLYVNGMSVPKTAARLYNLAKSLLLFRYKPTLSDQLAPRLSFSLKALGLATAALSYGPSVQISDDYFKGSFAVYMEVANSCATILITSTAILDIVDQIVELSLTRLGSEEARQLVELDSSMRRFSYLLANSPLLEFAVFANGLPGSIFSSLIRDTEITQENLSAYITEQTQGYGESRPLLIQDRGEE